MFLAASSPFGGRGGGGGGLLLFLLLLLLGGPPPFLPGPGRMMGGVSGQLYTKLEDLAVVQDLPLQYMTTHKGTTQTTTCLAKVSHVQVDNYNFTAETHDYFRSMTKSTNFNPHYFCSNVPRLYPGFGAPHAQRKAGHVTPYSNYWLKEATGFHWAHRTSVNGPPATTNRWMQAKEMGFIFRVDVTGIKARGRFLKGWYHLKISLDIDHNLGYDKAPLGTWLPYPQNDFTAGTSRVTTLKGQFAIDKLMVTARGRILIPGKNRPNVKRPARRAWVGGIGEFVQDFPKCAEAGYNPTTPYINQQFMPCGAVQYSESKYGNNFYYSRGPGGGKGEDAIHLNFRLDNSFCNRYYDLDFIANGIVMDKNKGINLDGNNHPGSYYSPTKEIFVVQRSISTRFVFISSHENHWPSYYENAEPIPRDVPSVECKEELQAEWKMKTPYESPVSSGIALTDKVKPHTVSVTEGAILTFNPATPDSTFGGAIKFIYEVPKGFGLFTGASEQEFGLRRTWTYPPPFALGGQGFSGDYDMWGTWKDPRDCPEQFSLSPWDHIKIGAAVQRVLREFDWESWRSLARNPHTLKGANLPNGGKWQETSLKPVPAANYDDTDPKPCTSIGASGCRQWCNAHGHTQEQAMAAGGEFWPHVYYDATCVGLDVKQTDVNHAFVRDLVKAHSPSQMLITSAEPNRFQAQKPQITGRCPTNLWYNDGTGSLSSIPPPCNEFFKQYSDKKNSDPALGLIVEATAKSGRKPWDDDYGPDAKDGKLQNHIRLCKVIAQLKEKFPGKCNSAPPYPLTTTPDPNREAEKMRKFRLTRAYKRGLLVTENPYSLFVFDSRVLHALTMTIIVMFIIPVSLFLTRYFKETFMDSRVFLHHVWYFVHLGCAFLTPLLFIVAMWRLVGARSLLGVSWGTPATLHRILGWVAIAIASSLFLLGGIRCMNRFVRATIICLHFVLGWLFYLISLALIFMSIAIPGSPSAYQDVTIVKEDQKLKYFLKEPIFLIVLAWTIFDIVMHILMSIYQCRNDRKMKLTEPRICFGPGMPVILENFRFDTPGRFIRIYALRLYVVVALITTIAMLCLIRLHSPRGRGYGFMTCTHSKGPQYDVLTKYPPPCLK